MKYFFSVLFSIVLLNVAIAQDYKKITTLQVLGKIEESKVEIDKMAADPKAQGKAETWYWKSKIYAAINKNEALRAKYPTIAKDADDAFKKYLEMDPAFALVKEKGAEGFFDMYATSFNKGLEDFKTKTWPAAAADFEMSSFYSDYIFKNKWANSTAAFDTTSILYAAYANQNAQKMDDAAKYYNRLAEAKATGENFQDVYKFLGDHYIKRKDKANFDRVIALGKEVYPKENWEDYEVEFMDQNFTLAEKTAFYDKGDAAGTLSENQYLQFGDVFANVHHKETDSTIFEKYSKKALEAFKKSFYINNKNYVSAFNIAVLFNNILLKYEDDFDNNIRNLQKINSNKVIEKDPKKKLIADSKIKIQIDSIKSINNGIDKMIQSNIDSIISWSNKSYEILLDKVIRTKTEKSIINKSVDFLINSYEKKMNKFRGKDLKNFEYYEAKFKYFEPLHETFGTIAIKIGMNKDQVIKLVGSPDKISSTITKSNSTELYLYKSFEIGFDSKGIVDYVHELN